MGDSFPLLCKLYSAVPDFWRCATPALSWPNPITVHAFKWKDTRAGNRNAFPMGVYWVSAKATSI